MMKTFTMFRRNVPDTTHDANQKNAPDEPQFEGCVFSDGRVAIRWLTAKRSVAVWDSMEDMLAIHGHPEYGSELVWDYAIDPAKDFLDDDLRGIASRVVNFGLQSAEIEHRALVGYSHYYRKHIFHAAMEMLRTVVLHERQRAKRDASSLFPTHYTKAEDTP